MSSFFSFVVNHPFLFILLALVIYVLVTYNLQKRKIDEIKKTFKPIGNYLEEKFILIEKLNNALFQKYQSEDKVLNELHIIKSNIELFKSENIDDKIKAANGINNFVLNSGLLRNNEYEELKILANIELFMPQPTEESQTMEARRLKYNQLVTDFNHDNLNPPNSYVAKLFGIDKHYTTIENNVGKTPKEPEKSYIKIEKREISNTDTEETKVCPNCHTEFSKSKFCPTCGNMVIK
ncbi:MAG: LemA family protein [Bacilli bacterium]